MVKCATRSVMTREAHSYEYDNNGNIVYVNTSRLKPDMTTQSDTVQRGREERFRWDEENRLTALSQNVTKEPSPCHIGWIVDAGINFCQATAVIECMLANGGDGVGDGHRGQAAAA